MTKPLVLLTGLILACMLVAGATMVCTFPFWLLGYRLGVSGRSQHLPRYLWAMWAGLTLLGAGAWALVCSAFLAPAALLSVFAAGLCYAGAGVCAEQIGARHGYSATQRANRRVARLHYTYPAA